MCFLCNYSAHHRALHPLRRADCINSKHNSGLPKAKYCLQKKKEKSFFFFFFWYREGNAKLLSKNNSDHGNSCIKDNVGAVSHFKTKQHHKKMRGMKKPRGFGDAAPADPQARPPSVPGVPRGPSGPGPVSPSRPPRPLPAPPRPRTPGRGPVPVRPRQSPAPPADPQARPGGGLLWPTKRSSPPPGARPLLTASSGGGPGRGREAAEGRRTDRRDGGGETGARAAAGHGPAGL